MKLSHAEATQLFKGLLAAFPNPVKLDIILGQPPMNTSLARIVTGGTLDDDYFQLVTAANAEGWIGQLLDGLRAADKINPDLIALIDGFAGTRAPTDVPAHLELLLDGTPFVNQHPLRHALLTMTQPHGPKVLQVTGAPASGRTYSQYLIAHVGRRMNARVYLSPPIEATTTARDVIEDLALMMRLGSPPTLADAPQDSTAVTRMVRWFVAASQDLQHDWWLVFDGFDTQKIDDSVLMLMHGLAQTVAYFEAALRRAAGSLAAAGLLAAVPLAGAAAPARAADVPVFALGGPAETGLNPYPESGEPRHSTLGFTIDNPNAAGSCACGDSFH